MKKLENLNLGCADFSRRLNAAILPPSLLRINLNSARLTQLPEFGIYTPNITEFLVSGNRIGEISQTKVAGLLALTRINMKNNEFSTVPDLYHLPLTHLKLARNPLVCNRSLCWIRMWPWAKASLLDVDGITCGLTGVPHSVLLTDINPATLDCHHGKYYYILHVYI